MDDQLRDTIASIVELLVNGSYEKLQQMTNGERLSADMMRKAVSQYGKLLRMPDNFDSVDVIPIASVPQVSWSVYIPLYTVQEGRSDLTLLLRISRKQDGKMQTIIDDIRTL